MSSLFCECVWRSSSPYINHFLQPDTIIPDPSDPQSFNRFSYVQNNPVRFNDPTGHVHGTPPDGREYDGCWTRDDDGNFIRNPQCQEYESEEEHVTFVTIVEDLLADIVQVQPGINILMASGSEEENDETAGTNTSTISSGPPGPPGSQAALDDLKAALSNRQVIKRTYRFGDETYEYTFDPNKETVLGNLEDLAPYSKDKYNVLKDVSKNIYDNTTIQQDFLDDIVRFGIKPKAVSKVSTSIERVFQQVEVPFITRHFGDQWWK